MTSKTWIVALHEYRRLVLTRQFLFSLLIVPLLACVVVGLGVLTEKMRESKAPVGYVDQSGLLTRSVPKTLRDRYENPVQFVAYKTEKAATAGIESKEIQAYYLISADYLNTNRLKLFYKDRKPEKIHRQFVELIKVNLLKDKSPMIIYRMINGGDLTTRLLRAGREFSGSPTFGQLLPLIGSFILMLLIFISSTNLTQIVSAERESRALEILITSISPKQLIGGKLFGILATTLTQFLFWLGLAILALIAGRFMGYEWLRDINIDPWTLLLMVGLLVPAYIMVTGLIAAIGATVSSGAASQQISGMFVSIMMLLMTLIPFALRNPAGPVAVGMSLFPLTSPMTLPIRTVISDVPVWQIAASFFIIISAALFAVWFAGRALRMALLVYGKRLRLRDIARRTSRQRGELRGHT